MSIEKDVFAQNKVAIIAALKFFEFNTATAKYEGSGDSGGVESVDLDPEINPDGFKVTFKRVQRGHDANRSATVTEMEVPLREAIESLAYDVISLAGHDGWENNDGGYGHLTIDVVKGSVKLEHTGYLVDTHTSECEF